MWLGLGLGFACNGGGGDGSAATATDTGLESSTGGSTETDGGEEPPLAGFVIDGPRDHARATAFPCGDVNGDGRVDLAVNVEWNEGEPAAYVVFGKEDPTAVDLAVTESGAYRPIYADPDDPCGLVLSGVGDINADGFDDLLAATRAHEFPGVECQRSYVLFGGVGSGSIELSGVAAGLGGFAFDGADGGWYGGNGVGDINADGIDDFAVHGSWAFQGAAVYVIFGRPGLDAITVAGLEAHNGGFVISDDDSGDMRLRPAGDINGDGLADALAIRNGHVYNPFRAAYVVLGAPDLGTGSYATWEELATATLLPLSGGDIAADASGDFDGDGLADIALGFTGSATSWLVHGGPGVVGERGIPDSGDIGIEHGSWLFSDGDLLDEPFRSPLAFVPDLNGDGRSELLLAWLSDDAEPDTYVLYGREGDASFDVTALAADEGTRIGDWPEGQYLGDAVGWADIDGVHPLDLVLTDREHDAEGISRGRTYVLFDVLPP